MKNRWNERACNKAESTFLRTYAGFITFRYPCPCTTTCR